MPAPESHPTVQQALSSSIVILRQHRIESPVVNAELLLGSILHVQRSALRSILGRPLTAPERKRFEDGIERLLRQEPVQYITGDTVFMGLELEVDRNVLIPRPETELLAEMVIEQYRGSSGAIHGLDIGTGTGNIPIALCHFLGNIEMYSVDINEMALNVARRNIERYGFGNRIVLVLGDILREIPVAIPHELDLLISNPPYISEAEYRQVPPNVRMYEPPGALTDHADGLTYYRRIADIGTTLLKTGGRCAMEISYDQAKSVSDIFINAGYSDLRLTKDYSGIERFISVRRG